MHVYVNELFNAHLIRLNLLKQSFFYGDTCASQVDDKITIVPVARISAVVTSKNWWEEISEGTVAIETRLQVCNE